MGSYATITITGPAEEIAAIKLRKLPDFDLFDLTQDWERDGDEITVAGNDKYSPERMWVWARKYSAKHPNLTVTYRDEWDTHDADEPGMEEKVYRAGELVESESRVSGEVPMNLDEVVTEGRALIQAYYSASEGDSADAEYAAGIELAEAFDQLLKQLSP